LKAEIREKLERAERNPHDKRELKLRSKSTVPHKGGRGKMVVSQKCPVHGFAYISMPRQEDEDDFGYVAKCVWNTCAYGIHRSTDGRGNFVAVADTPVVSTPITPIDVFSRRTDEPAVRPLGASWHQSVSVDFAVEE